MEKIKGKVVLLPMLPTKRKTWSNLQLKGIGYDKHMYILSDEKIQEGDWYINLQEDREIVKKEQMPFFCDSKLLAIQLELPYSKETSLFKKVIVTSDPSLNLPLISQEFIQQYCENPVEDVWVEFNEEILTMVDPPEGWKYGFPKPYNNLKQSVDDYCIEKGYPKELVKSYGEHFTCAIWENITTNIIITPIQEKETWTRDEVEVLCINAYGIGQINRISIRDWIKENL